MEWKEVVLGELVDIYDSKRIPLTSQEREKIKGDIPYYGAQGIIDYINQFLFDGEYILIAEDGNNIKSRQENIAQIAKGKFWVNNHAHILQGKIEQNLLCYIINHTDISGYVTGSAQPKLNQANLLKIPIKIPVNLSDQRKIAGILSALDAKIENNNKINANLEAQAQALFKSWFVDFTPFKDQPFVDSELGPIPQGWKVGKLGDYVEIKRGGSPRPIQKFLTSQGLNWLKISDATSTQSPFIFNIKEKIIIDGLKKTVFLKAGSLVLSNSATPCIPKFLSIDSCIHDGWLYFPHSQLPKNYLYLFFKLMRNNLVSKANGSVFLNLKTDIVKNQVFAFSGEEIYNSFDKIIAPLFKEIEKLTYETFQLSALRDTLLPKLMSGEIKL